MYYLLLTFQFSLLIKINWRIYGNAFYEKMEYNQNESKAFIKYL